MLDNYEYLTNGIIKQKIQTKKIQYDAEYKNKYNQYGELGRNLGFLRLGYLLGQIGFIPDTILDVGFGNGDFLKATTKAIKNCFGTDINNQCLPEGCTFLNWTQATQIHFDVICFFDSLEHFDDIYIITQLKATYIFITLPWCHNYNDQWLLNWKHLRPDEHLWHFNQKALIKFFHECGYTPINTGVPFEDCIRIDHNYTPNILTGIFKKI